MIRNTPTFVVLIIAAIVVGLIFCLFQHRLLDDDDDYGW